MSQDIVATDYWGRELLLENGCNTTGQATHIDTAAQPPYNLGTNDPSQMEVINIYNPMVGTDEGNSAENGFILKQNYPNPFRDNTRIEFYVPGKENVNLSVYNTNGQQIRVLTDKTLKSGWHTISWDGRNELGQPAAGGLYVARLTAPGYQKSLIMQLIN
jgi:hypothetical protein